MALIGNFNSGHYLCRDECNYMSHFYWIFYFSAVSVQFRKCKKKKNNSKYVYGLSVLLAGCVWVKFVMFCSALKHWFFRFERIFFCPLVFITVYVYVIKSCILSCFCSVEFVIFSLISSNLINCKNMFWISHLEFSFVHSINKTTQFH